MASLLPVPHFASLRHALAWQNKSPERRIPVSDPSGIKNPLTSFPSSAELEAYPAPASFVVQGEICEQCQSPLFSKIPPEIRNEIFRLALVEYVPEGNDWTGKLSEIQSPGYGNVRSTGKYVRRPGYEGLKTVDTDLLRTCKRVSQILFSAQLQNACL